MTMDEERHTQREYELEKQLWETLDAIQRYFIAKGLQSVGHEQRRELERAQTTIATRLDHWREHPGDYLRHPDWQKEAR